MAFLDNIEQLRSVDWGSKYLWDIQFEGGVASAASGNQVSAGPPAPFDKWFPAVDVTEDQAHLDSYSFDGPQDSFKIPQNATTLGLQITFHDDQNQTLLKWLRTWMQETILGKGLYVSTLDRSVKQLHLLKLDHQRNTIDRSDLWVYPEGTLTYSGDSSSDSLIYTTSFVIVGNSARF